jgi:NAD(P)-dependent dehydrogenase (short-subunit alcohol dehydrogenase family)
MSDSRAAIVIGVGPSRGLGGALSRRFAREGLHVFAAGRTAERVEAVAAEIGRDGGTATPVVADATAVADVTRLFETAEREGGPIEIVVYNAGNNYWKTFLETTPDAFEQIWRVSCFGGFLVGQEAARRMIPHRRGSIFFSNATAALRGKPMFTAFSAAKFGLRSLAQSMARDLGPRGIHVATVVIDGVIDGELVHRTERGRAFAAEKGENGLLSIDAIADSYWFLHRQDPTTWTQEMDLRPAREPF